ncbi:MAG TPA: AAA family ATPase [Blastocatellia bacterium]|nr:AAA family ATPase [Blastocatellia bacterium]
MTENLRLVVLACCQSGDYSAGKALQAPGPRLVHLGAPAVIAMQDFVPIPAAQLFTQHFYDDLARSGRVDMAMAATRFALYSHYRSHYRGQSREWAIPVLLMCNDDGKLFNIDRLRAAQLEELRPDIRTYNQLDGGDPTANKLARVFETEARNQRIDEKTIGLLREAVSAAMRGQALRPESEPIAQQQDRRTLSDIIKFKVRINPAELRQFVETSGSKLELPASVYQQVASALNTRKHVIFIGPPGTGKTSLANDICAFAKKEGFTTGVRPTTATADWSTFDTVGGYIPAQDQTLQFRPGIFLRAICEAEWLVIDEINRAEIDKAFGELFTALSGQGVDLPYWVGAKQVRILPAEKDFDQWWDDGLGAKSYDYVMRPNWRIVAAMNAYDRSSLYALSFAFMRRFAFIDIDLPDAAGYHALLERWMDEFDPPLDEIKREPLRVAMQKLIARDCFPVSAGAGFLPAADRIGRMESSVRNFQKHSRLRAVTLPAHITESHLLKAEMSPVRDYAEVADLYQSYARCFSRSDWRHTARIARRVLPLPAELTTEGETWIELGAELIREGREADRKM